MLAEFTADGSIDLEELVRSGLIRTYFSPVIDVFTGRAAGYRVTHMSAEEAAGGAATSEQLRRVIRGSEMVGDFDSSFRDQSLRDAEAAGLPFDTSLFVNSEPESLVTLEDRTERSANVILQLDPARIAAQPGTVLRSVRSARQLGWTIGITGVGLDPATTALLPLVNPTVISLHPDVLRLTDRARLVQLNELLRAHIERTDAVLMAEGVSCEEDLVLVRSLGARLVAGPYYGAPALKPQPVDPLPDDVLTAHGSRNVPIQGTPYSIAQGLKRDPLVVDYDLMIEHMVQMLTRARAVGRSAVVVGVFGEEEELPEAVRTVFHDVGQTVGLAAILSGGFDESPIADVRSGPVDHSDPLRREYAVIAVGPDWSSMVTAHRRSAPGVEGRLEFDLLLTTQRYPAIDAARSVLSRIRLQQAHSG